MNCKTLDHPLPEAVIQRVLLARLNAIPCCFFDRINTVVAQAGGRHVRSARSGTADILGCAEGIFVAIEVKSATGRQSTDQAEYQRKVEAAGGLYLIARDVDSTLAAVRAAMEARHG